MNRIKALFYLNLLATLPYFFALPLDLIDIDTAQYGEISREMVETGEYLHLPDNGRKYLDKPVLTFWIISAFFKIFGVSNWSFRLPAILFGILTAYIIYRLTHLISGNRERSLIASLLYLTCPGLMAMVLNPIIDVYITAYITLAIYFYYMGVKKNSNWFYLMYWFMGMGFITKGPISVIIPAIAIGGDILFRRDWKRLVSMKIPQGIIITAILPGFWSWILYQDFNMYGPYFFLWLQSFGRFYKKMYNQRFNPGFFYSNFGWTFGVFFLPLISYAIFKIKNTFFEEMKPLKAFKEIFTNIIKNNYKNEDFTFPFWVFLYLILISFSRYQLPQYVYWILPGAAIYTSGILSDRKFLFGITETIVYYFSAALFFGLVIVSPIFSVTPGFEYYIIIISFTGIYYILRKHIPGKILLPFFSAILFFTLVSVSIWPELLKFQPSKEIAKIIKKEEKDQKIFYTFLLSQSKRSYAFYSGRLMRNIYDPDKFLEVLEKDGERIVLIPEEYIIIFPTALKNQIEYEIIGSYPSYKMATVKPKFLLKSKRESVLKNILVLKVRKK